MKYFLVRSTAQVGEYNHFIFFVVKAKNLRGAKGIVSESLYREGDRERNSCSCCGDGMPIYKLDEIEEITKAKAETLESLERLEVVHFLN